jgi:hypothetical protein
MPIQVILSQKGPLPLTANFNALGDMPVYIEVNGSIWTQSVNAMIGIAVQLDGHNVGTAQIWSNGSSTHRAVVPAYIAAKLTQGQHKLTLLAAPGSSTISDFNDWFTAVIHY